MDVLEHEWERLLRLIFSRVIIIRAELMWANKSVEYVGMSPCFGEVEEGEESPYYYVVFDRGNISFQRSL